MPETNWQRALQWLHRRWYRALLPLAAIFLIGSVILAVILLGVSQEQYPIIAGAGSGLITAFLFGLVHVVMSMIGVMRVSTSLRGVLAVVVPTLAVVVIARAPINLDLQVIPMVLIYCLCLSTLVTGLAFRRLYRVELVARGNRIFATSSPRSEAALVALLLLFFWGQYRTIGGWYAVNAAPNVLGWSVVLSAATSWGFIARSRFGDRRLAYAIALPLAVVALFGMYIPFRQQSFSLWSWRFFLALAVMAPLGWLLSQELSSRLLAACGWRWRSIRRRRLKTRSATRRQQRVQSQQQPWSVIGWLFLLAVASVTFSLLLYRVVEFRFYYAYLLTGGLRLGVGMAAFSSIVMLVANQRRNLILDCVLIGACGYLLIVIMMPKLHYGIYEYLATRLYVTVSCVAIVTVIHVLVRIIDQFSDFTFGVTDIDRQPIGIRNLMILTLVIGLEFALLRFTETYWILVLLISGLVAAIWALLMYRSFFVGINWPSVIVVVGLTAVCFHAGQANDVAPFSAEFIISYFVFVATLIAILRTLRRLGWKKVALLRVDERSDALSS